MDQIHLNPFLKLASYTTIITFPSQIHMLFCCLYAHGCRTIHERMGSQSVGTTTNKTEQNQTKQLSPRESLIANNFSAHSTRQNSQLVLSVGPVPHGWVVIGERTTILLLNEHNIILPPECLSLYPHITSVLSPVQRSSFYSSD